MAQTDLKHFVTFLDLPKCYRCEPGKEFLSLEFLLLNHLELRSRFQSVKARRGEVR